MSAPITVELEVTGHFSMGHSIRRLLQAERLEVNANTAVRDDEEGVNRALHPSSIVTVETEHLNLKTQIKICISFSVNFPSFLLSGMIQKVKLTCCTCVA